MTSIKNQNVTGIPRGTIFASLLSSPAKVTIILTSKALDLFCPILIFFSPLYSNALVS